MTFLANDKQRFAYFSRLAPKAPTQSRSRQESGRIFGPYARALSKVRPFEVYSTRHTFLTRLGESGCNVWTLARVAGHSSIVISARYVHPSSDAVLRAMARKAELSGPVTKVVTVAKLSRSRQGLSGY